MAPSTFAQARPTDLLLGKARSLEASGRIDLAVQAWQQALLIDPVQQEALAGLARASLQVGKANEAAAYLDRLRRINPKHPAITDAESQATLQRQRGRLDEAAKLAAAGQNERAVAIYRQAFGDAPPAGRWAVAYYETLASTPGGWERATEALADLLKATPDSADYKLSLGRLYTYRPATRKQGLDLLQSLSSVPGYAQRAQAPWRQALIWEDGSARSADSVRAYIAKYPDPEIEALAKKERQVVAQAVQTGPDLRSAYNFLKADNLVAAEAQFNDALKTFRNHSGALAGMGYIRMKQQNFADAAKFFDAASAQTPNNKVLADAAKEAKFWMNVQAGGEALKAKRTAEAETAFSKALEARPTNVQALEGYAGALMQRGDDAGAITALNRLIKEDGQNLEAWRSLVRAKHQKEGWKAALEVVSTMPPAVREKLATDPDYLANLTTLYQEAGQTAAARKAFDQASALLRSRPKPLASGLMLQMASLNLEFGDPTEAASLYRQAIDAQPENLDAWEGYLISMSRAGRAGESLRTLQNLPVSVQGAAQARPGFLRAAANAKTAVNDLSGAEELLNKALAVEMADGKPASHYTQLQLAQVWMAQEHIAKAIQAFEELTRTYPENAEAWKGLVLALFKDKRYEEAANAARMPSEELSAVLANDPDYLSITASVYQEIGQFNEATQMIRRAIERYRSERKRTPPALMIQLAWLLLKTPSSERELFLTLREAQGRVDFTAEQRRTVSDIWVAWLTQASNAARTSGDPDRAVAILQNGVRMLPNEVRLQRTLAGMLFAAGDSKRALATYKAAGLRDAEVSDYLGAIGTALTENDKRASAVWMAEAMRAYPRNPELLNLAGKQAALRGDYKTAGAYWRVALQMLQAEERQKLEETLPIKTGDAPVDDLGVLLLSGPGRTAQDDSQVPNGRAATTYRLPWEIAQRPAAASPAAPPSPGARPTLPPASSPVASTLLDQIIEDQSSRSGAAAQQGGAGQGRAQEPAREPAREPVREPARMPARVESPAPGFSLPAPSAPRTNPTPSLPPISAAAPPPIPPPTSSFSVTNRNAVDQLLSSLEDAESREELKRQLKEERKIAQDRGQSDLRQPNARQQDLRSPILPNDYPIPGVTVDRNTNLVDTSLDSVDTIERERIREQLGAMENRNSPFVGMGGHVSSRSGEAGFNRMILQESLLESSMMLNNKVRLSVVARPFFADSGTPDGESTLRFGMLPVGDTFEAQSVSGIGGEVQLSTQTFGMRFGSTPRGFPVRNIIAGARFQPGGGPITITFDRDSVKDTMLSYAGARDPLSRRIWGGVIADTGSLAGSFGDEKSGGYFNIGFQHITGQSVQTNQRIDGTVGGYWRLYTGPVGSLNAGVNLFAMHYEKNLRYFTFGHGGYFSPQQFLLFNVPVQWRGKWRQLDYTAATSIGGQSFRESASPFFPTESALQGQTGPYYPSLASSGVNYNVDFRAAYQITGNWFLTGFLNVNNARFYTLQSVGVSVKYLFRPRPMTPDLAIPSVPDWRGRQPFGLP